MGREQPRMAGNTDGMVDSSPPPLSSVEEEREKS
jgi:hypothetical protein